MRGVQTFSPFRLGSVRGGRRRRCARRARSPARTASTIPPGGAEPSRIALGVAAELAQRAADECLELERMLLERREAVSR
jgi:hypothetical protein